MARLLKDDKSFIKNKLINRAFDERKKALKDEGHALHTVVCEAAFGEHWKAVAKLPAKFFETNLSIHISVPGAGSSFSLQGHQAHAVPNSFDNYWHMRKDGGLDSQSWLPKPVYDLCVDWAKRMNEINLEEAEAKRQIDATLSRATTYKALFLAWPELIGVIPEPPTPTAVNRQLAPYMPALNKTLGLPVCETPSPSKKPVATGSKKRRTKAS